MFTDALRCSLKVLRCSQDSYMMFSGCSQDIFRMFSVYLKDTLESPAGLVGP